MRKWIFSTTVFVLALVAWKLYLDDDLKRFTQNLPKAPAPTQDLAEPPARIITTPVNVEPEEPAGNVSDDTSDIPANVPVEITDTSYYRPVFSRRVC